LLQLWVGCHRRFPFNPLRIVSVGHAEARMTLAGSGPKIL
jgi:hypothetical protein